VIVAGLAFMAVVAAPHFQHPETRLVTLPSGRRIEVIQMGVNDSAPHEWSLDYRTRLPMNQPEKVACEVAAIWSDVRTDAERVGATRALVAPQNFSIRILSSGWRFGLVSHVSTGYIFSKSATGQWTQRGGPRCVE
jgi:hypothetical protein